MDQLPDKSLDNLVIEPMGEEHVPDVAAIETASFSDPWPLESFQSELHNNCRAFYLVARCSPEEEIVGYIGAWQVLDEVHITTLAVAEKYRRHGIASRLVETLLAAAAKKGTRFITLEVRPSNMAARKFYEKFGFNTLGRRKRYYSDEDALIMTREL